MDAAADPVAAFWALHADLPRQGPGSDATTRALFAHPRHPYTVGLLTSVPRLDASRKERLTPIAGLPRDLTSYPDTCAFAPRCWRAVNESREKVPPLRPIDSADHFVACFNPVPLEGEEIPQDPPGTQTEVPEGTEGVA